jgi:2-dehydro-3-deoxyphosphogluconate aldolase/(4S)-4-hydroxy-2-oxoglutarate aldolase
MVKDDLISSGKFDEITKLVKEAVSRLIGFEFAHLGINEESEENAIGAANDFSQLFNFPVKIGTRSVFAGTDFEVTKKPFLGKKGHIAIATNNMDRAIAYLKRKSVSTVPETASEKDGKLQAIYLKKEISGFAVHLLQK